MHTISTAKLAEFHDAYGYGQVSPVAWLYRQLLALHELVQHGTPVRVDPDGGTILHSPEEFTIWVRQTFPGFRDDTLHPFFSER